MKLIESRIISALPEKIRMRVRWSHRPGWFFRWVFGDPEVMIIDAIYERVRGRWYVEGTLVGRAIAAELDQVCAQLVEGST